MSTIPSELDDHRYWKAAISHLPTQMQRDAAWEFFLNRFVGNPNAADTISGIVMVMEAHGLYMLALPRKFHDEAVSPLEASMGKFHEDSQKLLAQQAEANKASLEACAKSRQTAEEAAMAVKELDDAIRNGWQEVKTDKLAERIHEELETTLFRPLAVQCQELEDAAPALVNAADKLKESAGKLQTLHSKGVLTAMMISCLVVMGGCLFYGWLLLSEHYNLKIAHALARIESLEGQNREAFTQLTKMNIPIRIMPVVDEKQKVVPGEYVLILGNAKDARLRDTSDGQEGIIFFKKAFY